MKNKDFSMPVALVYLIFFMCGLGWTIPAFVLVMFFNWFFPKIKINRAEAHSAVQGVFGFFTLIGFTIAYFLMDSQLFELVISYYIGVSIISLWAWYL